MRARCVRFLSACGVAVAAALGGCANPFLEHYSGVRCPPVNTAHVAVGTPTDATLIGTSDFVTDVAVGNPQAIAAAERVGADIVQWDRAFLRQEVPLLRESLAGDGMTPSLPAGAGVLPVEDGAAWYRIHARFWRSNALGGIPAPAEVPAAGAEQPVPEPSGGAGSAPAPDPSSGAGPASAAASVGTTAPPCPRRDMDRS